MESFDANETDIVKKLREAKTDEERLEIEASYLTQSDNRPQDDDPIELPDSEHIRELSQNQ